MVDFGNIEHFTHYPEMTPWVGDDYKKTGILVVAQGFHIDHETFHHDDEAWYEKRPPELEPFADYINTKYSVDQCEKGKKVTGRIAKALLKCEYFRAQNIVDGRGAFQQVAYMNFFQRPVRKYTGIDAQRSNEIFKQVLVALSPKMIAFTSVRAHDTAAAGGSIPDNIPCVRSQHPTGAGGIWWYIYGQRLFISFLNEQVNT